MSSILIESIQAVIVDLLDQFRDGDRVSTTLVQ